MTSSVPQSVIVKVVHQWRTRLRACVKAKGGHHFKHLLYTSADFRRDLTGFLQRRSQILEQNSRIVQFVVNVFSGSVETQLWWGRKFYMRLEVSSFNM